VLSPEQFDDRSPCAAVSVPFRLKRGNRGLGPRAHLGRGVHSA
jgi:hypothetical protein